ncbi:hypothetical protein RHGRI_017253 [Rhododendron griersonianum]|uniref:Uncharacterized protein n=1 Tax=Rhododendron griersonianum TaxID=479676 RepID=A0AAV6JX44_9ERIC|nr:hypothetical protein RHGRI_017253 [Rhododendron griersonianum]
MNLCIFFIPLKDQAPQQASDSSVTSSDLIDEQIFYFHLQRPKSRSGFGFMLSTWGCRHFSRLSTHRVSRLLSDGGHRQWFCRS